MTDETAKELAAAMLKLAEAINALSAKSNGMGGFTIYHQHSAPFQRTWSMPSERNPFDGGGYP